MAASIVLTGLASNDPVPGTYIQVAFAQGAASGFQGNRPILLIGNKTTAGSATVDTVLYGPDTPIPAQTEQDVINLTGAGSEIHRMWRRVTRWNQSTPVYFVCVAASAGVAATVKFTLTNVPTAAGTLRIWGADTQIDTSFNASDALATITGNAVTNINANVNLPFTASQALGVQANDSVLLTAKVAGLRGNWLRGMAAVIPGAAPTSNMTVSGTTDGFFTGGTVADSNTNALATINPKHFYYLVSAAEDATQFGALMTQITAQALPIGGNRQRGYAGSVDTSGAVTTIATGVNNARAEIVWSQGNNWTPAELAANAAGIYALYENAGQKPRLNYSGFGNAANDTWNVPVSRDPTLQPTRTTIKSLLQNGVTPIGWSSPTRTYLVKRITTYSLNGSNPDYRVRDAGKVTVCDFFADDLYAITTLNWQGKTFGDDPKPGAPPPDSSVITVGMYRSTVLNLIDVYGQLNLFQGVATMKSSTIVQRDAANNNRLDVFIPASPVDICDQFALLVAQVA